MKLEFSEARQKQDFTNKIHIDKLKVNLVQCEPTRIKPDEISRQLHNMGLYCEETRGERLKKNIEDVQNRIKYGTCDVFGVFRQKAANSIMIPPEIISQLEYCNGKAISLLTNAGYEKIANGVWEPGHTGCLQAKLLTVIHEANYSYLKENEKDFPWAEASTNRDMEVSTLEAIKALIIDAAEVCSATIVKGITRSAVETIFSRITTDIKEGVLEKDYYSAPDPQVVEIVENYNPSTGDCDAVGAIWFKWKIDIKNYREKKKETQHKVSFYIEARSVLYSSAELLKKHYEKVCNRSRLSQMLTSNTIHVGNSVTVFDSKPEPSAEVFAKSLPSTVTYDYVDAIVFYQADVQKLGFFDNTESSAVASYTKSITSGFSTAFTVGLSAEVNFEMSAAVAKFGAKFGFNVSLTNQWTQTQTDTISFQIPAGKKAYLYQVTLLCARLRYYPGKIKYEYVEYGKFLSDAYKTTENPLYEDKMKG